MNPEVFYLHINGEQRGPYTIPQIDHLVNSALIPEETLYWREGMEQWLPVTQLVAVRRKPATRWLRRGLLLLALLVVLFFARLFGPIAVVGWRETAQYDFTPHAAYWRARDVIRHQAAPSGAVINFTPQDRSRVEMTEQPAGARVSFRAEIPGKNTSSWVVTLGYDRQSHEWAGRSVEEVKP